MLGESESVDRKGGKSRRGEKGGGIEAAGPDDGQRLRAEGSESKRERLRTMQGL